MFCIKNKSGFWVKIDHDDLEKIYNIKWHIDQTTENYFRVVASVNGRPLLMHRHILCAKPGEIIDHINGDTFDNRKINLRFCTSSENSMNQKVKPGKKYKGIYFDKSRKLWAAQITAAGKTKTIGRYLTDKQAAIAYNEIAKKLHGDFAKLNEVF